MTNSLPVRVIEELLRAGVREFVVCPGGRNAPFVDLITASHLRHTLWYEERSAAFYALGRARGSGRPVAVVVTSGTAAGELMPALMEAYYSSTPLIAVTADRPRRYRGTNAPQAAEQVDLFGIYTPLQYDLEQDERFSLQLWDGRTPVHLNVCLEEPRKMEPAHPFQVPEAAFQDTLPVADPAPLHRFLQSVDFPLVVVGALRAADREAVAQFLLKLQAPAYLEAQSGLRCDGRLAAYRVYDPQYKLHDGFLRIGGVPTHRLWRDLEGKRVYSISEHPFSGLPGGVVLHTRLGPFFDQFSEPPKDWKIPDEFFERQLQFQEGLLGLFQEEPQAEAALLHHISLALPSTSQVYLGNSLPIREWDLAASYAENQMEVQASRGLNGIDGQLSCFFGLCQPERLNVALLGDLTLLYDLAGPWCLQQQTFPYAILLINNGGGKIFARLFENPAIQNLHTLRFEHFAHFWRMPYQAWQELPDRPEWQGLIELLPDPLASERFWTKLEALRANCRQKVLAVR